MTNSEEVVQATFVGAERLVKATLHLSTKVHCIFVFFIHTTVLCIGTVYVTT